MCSTRCACGRSHLRTVMLLNSRVHSVPTVRGCCALHGIIVVDDGNFGDALLRHFFTGLLLHGMTSCILGGMSWSVVLWLSTPNIVSTDLVISSFFLYLIRLTYDSHAVSMFLFSFHIMLHALLTSFISVQCMAMPPLPSLPFCHRRAVASCITLFPCHGRA